VGGSKGAGKRHGTVGVATVGWRVTMCSKGAGKRLCTHTCKYTRPYMHVQVHTRSVGVAMVGLLRAGCKGPGNTHAR